MWMLLASVVACAVLIGAILAAVACARCANTRRRYGADRRQTWHTSPPSSRNAHHTPATRVETATHKTAAPVTYAVGVTPSDIAISPDQTLALVTNSNSYDIPGSDTVTVLDLARQVARATISDPSFDEPYRVAIDHAGRRAYVCNSGSPKLPGQQGTVSVVDLVAGKVVGVIPGFDGPGGVVLTRARAYVTNYGAQAGLGSGFGKTVSVVSLGRRKVVATIEVAQAPAALALSPCRTWLYVVSYVDGVAGTGVLSVVRRKTHEVVAELAGFFGPFGVAVAPSGRRAYVTNFGSNNFAPYGRTVSVVDLRALRIVREIEVGIQPAAIAGHPDGEHAYVSNYNALYAHPDYADLTPGEGTVSVIRLRDELVVAPTLSVGQSPAALKLSPDGRTLYVCKYTQRTVAALKL